MIQSVLMRPERRSGSRILTGDIRATSASAATPGTAATALRGAALTCGPANTHAVEPMIATATASAPPSAA